jgi:hypothetical protein
MGPLCSGLVRSSEYRPCQDVVWIDLALPKFDGQASDFLNRPAYEVYRAMGGVFFAALVLA